MSVIGNYVHLSLVIALVIGAANSSYAATCFSDANACINYTQLCVFATEQKTPTSAVKWSKKTKFAPHVKLAKRRGLTCGVKSIAPVSLLQIAFTNFDLAQRREIQSKLSDFRFYTSSIDGLYGTGTSNALKAYNKEYLESSIYERE